MRKIIVGMVLVSLFNMASANEELQEKLEEGRYQVEVGNYQAGRDNLETYLRAKPDVDAYIYLIKAQRGMGEFITANSTAKKAERRYPEDVRVVYERIITLDKLVENEKKSQWRKEKYREEYYEVYEGYLEMTEYADSNLIFDLGNKYFIDDYYEKAERIFLKDKNGDIKNLFGAATTARFLGNYRKSAGLYTRVLNMDPNFYEAYLGRGSAYQLSGDLTKAIKDMERYLDYKNDVDVYIAIANMYMSMERYSSAKSVLERASSNYPASQEVRDLLVEVYSKLKR